MLTNLPPAPPPSLLSLLSTMDAMQASDLFLSEGRAPAARIHGRVQTLDEPATTRGALDALINLALPGPARAAFDSSGDADTSLSLDNGQRYRLSIARQQGSLSVVARAVPTAALDPDDLGLPPAVMAFAERTRGLVLVTGATGSGKSTTLAALVHRINQTRPVHVVTIEDPIEFVHLDDRALITQREIGGDTSSFGTALKHVVRQSPDVIVIGEMRDQETMQVAISAALTGHLVFASLHTIDATQTLQRILSYYPEHLRSQAAMDLSLCLQGIVSQRLLPRADHKGRALAAEVLTSSAAVASLLRDQRISELQDLMRTLRSPGLQTFNQSLLGLFQVGAITYDQGLAYASNPDEFALSARGMSTGAGTFLTSADDSVQGELDLQRLLVAATSLGASDLHLATGRPPLVRVDGNMQALSEQTLSDGDMRMLLYSIMTGHQRSAYELERELDFAIALDDGRRFRVNAYFQRARMAAALRAIPDRIPDAESLELPEIVLEMGGRAQGLFLVVGPTGSGKSTTLACLVDRINRTRACRIITIEDPVEYAHQSHRSTVDQREVGSDTKSFARALKYALRQDPDVILVGEMRDLETISSALTAAETGHLVLATLHANDATQAIDRMIDVFPAHQQAQIRSMLASALLGVVSQRLLPRREAAGRVPAFEILVGTPAVRNLIRENKLHQMQSIMERSQREGMVTMDASLKARLDAGGHLLRRRPQARQARRRPATRAHDEPPAHAPGPSGKPGDTNRGQPTLSLAARMSLSRSPSILVVEPSRDDSDMLRFALVDGGIDTRRFRWVRTLQAAREARDQSPPDVVLARLRQPGHAVATRLAELRAIAGPAPLVVWGEDDDQEGILLAIRAGASECLSRTELPRRLAWQLRTAAERQSAYTHAIQLASERQAKESLEAIGKLAQGTALEVNNALAVASGALADLARIGPAGGDQLEETEAIAEHALERVAAAMDTLVAVGQRSPLNPEPIHLQTLLEGVGPMVSREAGIGVNIDQWLLPGLPHVQFDRAALTQIFVHLGSLAAAAMPEGGDLRIRGRLDAGGENLVVTVTDTGHQPTPEQVQAAHQPFTPLHGDSGPGLARIQGLLVQSGGALAVELPPEGGTRLVLRLPVAQTQPQATRDPRELGQDRDSHILLIEDEAALRRILGRALQEAGFTVRVAADVPSALRAAQQLDTVDLVLTDMILPGGRTDGLIQGLRAAHSGVPIVFMTGQVEFPDLPPTVRDAPVLRKPFRISAMLRTVRAQLQR